MSFDYQSALEAAKERVDIAAAWHGLALPGQCPAPGKGGKSPLREDRHGGSFCVSRDGRMFCDHACREHQGDVVRFIEIARQTDFKGARAILFELAGIAAPVNGEPAAFVAPPRPIDRHAVVERPLPEIPQMEPGTMAQWERLAKLRGLAHWSGVALAVAHGQLRFCTAYGHECWAVLDPGDSPCNVQVRRLDGGRFGEKKTLGFTGNWGAWPVGLPTVLKYPHAGVLLVEGAPDFLAAYDLHAQGRTGRVPVAMFGATQPVHDGALPLFTGLDVLIMPHNDDAGLAGAETWRKQLEPRAAAVQVERLPDAVKDLNEWVIGDGNDQAEP